MTWFITALIAVVITVFVYIGSRPVRIPREPDREGIGDEEALRAYDRVSRWPIFGYERRIVLKALSTLNLRGTLVDIGCGPGYLAARIEREFPGLRVIGLDNDDQILRIAVKNWTPRSYPDMTFLAGDVHRLPFGDNSLDCVVASLSFHHWTDAQTGLREIHRVLKPGGHLVIMDMRRDGWRFFYWALVVGEALVEPAPLRRINGAVGSFWSSYTTAEVESLLGSLEWQDVSIKESWGWFVARCQKLTGKTEKQ
ncbi:MAG: class I SAM-dependent methyltransferase [Dehalococcoidia bacterium]|nr:class I SAM-dependent methyltransferase [Dehalococcoidia bacterium]